MKYQPMFDTGYRMLGGGGAWGFRIGSLYTPVVDSRQCMAKPIQSYKVK